MVLSSLRSFVVASRSYVLSPAGIDLITPHSTRSFLTNAPKWQDEPQTVVDPKTEKAREYAIKYQGLLDKFRFELVAPKHFNHLMDLSGGFFAAESICNATGTNIDNVRNVWSAVIRHIIAAQAVHPVSKICYDKQTNKPIGFVCYDLAYRDPAKDPYPVDFPELSEQELLLLNPLETQTFEKIWELYPEEQVIVKGEAAFMDAAYRGTGLFQVLLDYNVDFTAFSEATGAKYMGTVCTAPATKGWYAKMGFKNVHKGPSMVKNQKGEMVPLMHGELLLMVNKLSEMTPVDVYPFWKEMGMITTPYDN